LDDVLAALDVHTSKFIAENCPTGDLLRGRAIILVVSISPDFLVLSLVTRYVFRDTTWQ